jgi:hypothetical protein
MEVVKIIRVETHPDYGTFGVMTIGGTATCVTLEPYSRDNASNVSCIPTGQYICKRYSSRKYPDTFEITGIQGRSYVLFHAGNVDENTAGCVLLGSEFGTLGGDRAILESGKAFNSFINNFKGQDQFRLTIVEEY